MSGSPSEMLEVVTYRRGEGQESTDYADGRRFVGGGCRGLAVVRRWGLEFVAILEDRYWVDS